MGTLERNFKLRCIMLGITATDAAAALGYSRVNLHRRVSSGNPQMETLRKLGLVAYCEPTVLMDEDAAKVVSAQLPDGDHLAALLQYRTHNEGEPSNVSQLACYMESSMPDAGADQ